MIVKKPPPPGVKKTPPSLLKPATALSAQISSLPADMNIKTAVPRTADSYAAVRHDRDEVIIQKRPIAAPMSVNIPAIPKKIELPDTLRNKITGNEAKYFAPDPPKKVPVNINVYGDKSIATPKKLQISLEADGVSLESRSEILTEGDTSELKSEIKHEFETATLDQVQGVKTEALRPKLSSSPTPGAPFTSPTPLLGQPEKIKLPTTHFKDISGPRLQVPLLASDASKQETRFPLPDSLANTIVLSRDNTYDVVASVIQRPESTNVSMQTAPEALLAGVANSVSLVKGLGADLERNIITTMVSIDVQMSYTKQSNAPIMFAMPTEQDEVYAAYDNSGYLRGPVGAPPTKLTDVTAQQIGRYTSEERVTPTYSKIRPTSTYQLPPGSCPTCGINTSVAASGYSRYSLPRNPAEVDILPIHKRLLSSPTKASSKRPIRYKRPDAMGYIQSGKPVGDSAWRNLEGQIAPARSPNKGYEIMSEESFTQSSAPHNHFGPKYRKTMRWPKEFESNLKRQKYKQEIQSTIRGKPVGATLRGGKRHAYEGGLTTYRRLEKQIEEQHVVIDMLDHDLKQAQETLRFPPEWQEYKKVDLSGVPPADAAMFPDSKLPMYLKGRVLLQQREPPPGATYILEPDMARAIALQKSAEPQVKDLKLSHPTKDLPPTVKESTKINLPHAPKGTSTNVKLGPAKGLLPQGVKGAPPPNVPKPGGVKSEQATNITPSEKLASAIDKNALPKKLSTAVPTEVKGNAIPAKKLDAQPKMAVTSLPSGAKVTSRLKTYNIKTTLTEVSHDTIPKATQAALTTLAGTKGFTKSSAAAEKVAEGGAPLPVTSDGMTPNLKITPPPPILTKDAASSYKLPPKLGPPKKS